MASSLRGTHNNLHILDISEGDRARALGLLEWIGVGDTGCYWKNGKTPGLDGFFTKCLISVGMLLLVLQSALATDGEGNYEASGFSAPLQDPAASAGPAHLLARLMREEEVSSSVHHTDPPGVAESTREQPAFSSILTMLASTVERPQTLVLSQSSPVISNQTNQWPSEDPARGIEPSSSAPAVTSILSSSSEETTMNDSSEAPVSLLSTSGEGDTSLAKNATTSHTSNTTIFRKAENTSTPVASTAIVRTTQETLTNATLHLTTVTTTNVDSTTEVAKTTTSTTMQPTSTAQMTVTATNVVTTDKITTTTSTMTTTPLTSTISITTQSPKIATPTADLHITSTTEVPLLQCNITEEIWVKTVLSIHLRRNRLDNTLKQNLPKGLTQALQRAFNDSSVHAKVMTLSSVSNMTVGYYVTSGSMVYMPSAVVESFNAYGIDNLMADIKQFVPAVQSLPVTATPWVPSPAINLQLKTVLRFVAPEDDIKSCSFAQRMEQRLENAFAEAESKVLNSYSRLSVQILSTLPSLGSPVVSLIYSVQNGSTTLNGTFSSNLLNQLTTELVGYFLLFPPFIIAEPLEYHNLNTSAATRVYWVITVIQDVDNSSLEGNYQSFASLMEQRLAELFVVAHQEGTRFRRATTVGSYTVQMVSIRRVLGPKSPAEMTYYVQLNGIPLPGTSAAKILNTVDSQTAALTLGYFVQLQAEPVVKDPPNNLWIIAAVLAPIGVVTVIIIIITAVLCRKNKGDFKADAMGNINPRAKTAYRREASYYHQPVQGFDYAKQHLGQQGGDEEALPVTQETMILPLPIRDAPLVQDRGIYQDGSTSKKTLSSEIRKSRLPSEDGSVISNESGKLNSGRGSSVQKVPAQQKMTKEEARKRTDPYDTSSGSLQLISIKPMAAPPCYSHPASSDRSQDSAILNGEVSMALKQKSDIEHYRNKLRLKAKRKGYYDFPAIETNSKSYGLRQRHGHENTQLELNKVLDHEEERASTYVKSRRRHSQMGTPAYRSRQSLNSPGPSGTEMDLLVMRERTRRGIRNSGYDAFRFTQLPDMAMGSPPPPIPPRTGPHSGPSLRRSTSDIGPKARTSESSVPDTQSQLDSDPYVPLTRLPLPAVTADQSMPHYSGNPITAVYAIPANRSGYSGYFAPTPPSSYRSPSWMSYPPEPDDLPHQWADSVPLPGYAEAFPHPRYPQSSPIMLPWQYSQASSVHGILDQPPTPSTVTSQQSLTDAGDISGTSLSKITTSALVKAIREEVAKLAKKQSDMFEFQV
ncbi:UPF0606 protein KIAA1549L-like isoform X2 [Megalops cyprinoides]|uniref:UPF0606 protein KIAA1549L-like isoform X2 n=1 Tax=Megalops cyprinoides TaxID=118141 RepID=UPI001864C4A8|nr:UPF0606 protein KIAA1549L-like isoform X2 [Megalops cyprinoides]